MRVRPLEHADAEAAAQAYARVAEERIYIGREPPVDVAKSAERVREWVRSEDFAAWILEEENRVAGSLTLERSGRDRGVAALGMLVVPEARGRGGGRALLDAGLAWARAEPGVRKVVLEVWVDNARAIALYASAGFGVEGVRRDHYRRADGSLRSALIMALFV